MNTTANKVLLILIVGFIMYASLLSISFLVEFDKIEALDIEYRAAMMPAAFSAVLLLSAASFIAIGILFNIKKVWYYLSH